jgi:CheY-like chemotaxis protein
MSFDSLYDQAERERTRFESSFSKKNLDRKPIGEGWPGTQTTPLRVLVLDDDPLFLRRVQQVADPARYVITVCESVADFVEAMNKGVYDVVLLDYYLDDFEGPEVADTLGAVPVVMMSNKIDPIEDNYPWPAPVRRFVNKKLGPVAVLEAAMDVMHR